MEHQASRRLSSWLDPRVEVRDSPIQGKGLFATKRIAEGEVVLRAGGDVLPAEALESLNMHSFGSDIPCRLP